MADSQPWPDGAADIVTAAINDASGYAHADDSAVWAPYVLRALHEAGLLAPQGVQRVEEWTVTYLYGERRGEPEWGQVFGSREDAEAGYAEFRKYANASDPQYWRRARATAFTKWAEA